MSKKIVEPDNTALRTALWRALHVQIDEKPHIIEDEIGYELIKPEKDWQQRPDMKFTQRLRTSIVARTRFIEDFAKEQIKKGIKQYIILGSGLDTFAQRNPEIITAIDIFEIDQADTLAWKEEKLTETGYTISQNLHFVPVNFESSSWWEELLKNKFDIHSKTFVSCSGVTLYLTKEAIVDTLHKLTLLSSGSSIAIAFYLPLELLDEEDRPMQEIANKGAKESGTPFVSFFLVEEVEEIAKEAGLKNIQTISSTDMIDRYFKNRTDKLLPASGEYFLVAEI